MIVLYRQKRSKRADEIQTRLEDMVAAHRVRDAGSFEGAQKELPLIEDSGKRYAGDEIEPFLLSLENELKLARMVSADACYVDPDDPSRCV